jgi:phenylacetate-CoA ligase
MKKLSGRSDDMLIIRGVNVFPSQIETVLINEGYPPNYQIILDRVNHTDTFEVKVEMTTEMFSDKLSEVEEKERALLHAMRAMLGISPKITLTDPGVIPRSEGKAVRVIDNRKI